MQTEVKEGSGSNGPSRRLPSPEKENNKRINVVELQSPLDLCMYSHRTPRASWPLTLVANPLNVTSL